MAGVRVLGHPVHQTLIPFPVGLLATSVGFDIAYMATGNGRWADIAYWMVVVGIVSALIAAVFGFLDWLSIPADTRAKRIGTLHGLGNLLVVILFALGAWLRSDNTAATPTSSFICSLLGVGLLLITGWLGGELVDRLGVGVDEDANVNATSSLSHSRYAERHI